MNAIRASAIVALLRRMAG